MEYQEALAFIRELTKFGYNFGLSRILKLLQLLGNPEESFKSVHVGGTNGKGSVCAFTASVLQAAGYKTGLFTSPHLHSYTERIRVNGENISKDDVVKYILVIKPLLEQMVSEGYEHPTEFEISTAMAFKYFADLKVDIAVIEVGLGGAIDSTNVIKPLVTAVTNVSFDHMDYLGTTIKEITEVKAGIIKEGIPCVTAAEGEALEIICKRCEEASAPLSIIDKDDATDLHINLPLAGRHQIINAKVADGIISLLQDRGFKICHQAIMDGFALVRWPARLEIISAEPLIILDAAHNHAGALALSTVLPQFISHKAVFLVGILGDKERYKMLTELVPFMASAVVTKPLSPRAGDWQGVKVFLDANGVTSRNEENILTALGTALCMAKENNLPLVITGSIYMVATARASLLSIEQE